MDRLPLPIPYMIYSKKDPTFSLKMRIFVPFNTIVLNINFQHEFRYEFVSILHYVFIFYEILYVIILHYHSYVCDCSNGQR
jgi:hypothetical protein